MTQIESIKRIERLGVALALWGGLVGVLLWCALLAIHGSAGLLELLFLIGAPICFGITLRLLGSVVEGFLTTTRS